MSGRALEKKNKQLKLHALTLETHRREQAALSRHIRARILWLARKPVYDRMAPTSVSAVSQIGLMLVLSERLDEKIIKETALLKQCTHEAIELSLKYGEED